MKTRTLSTLSFALPFVLAACGSSSTETTEPPITEPATTTTPTKPDVAMAAEAPSFTLTDVDGNSFELASLRGKTVVLEWFNPGCPFVKYAHAEGPLNAQPAKHTAAGVTWVAINSSAPGKQGHGLGVNKSAAQGWNMAYPVLLDESGEVGHLYGATSTPAMFVINPEGKLIYKGALDNAPLGKVEGEARNYVDEAIAAAAAGTMPEVRETPSYGCSVKYAQN